MFLCDTNIISELVRPSPNTGVVDWAMQNKEASLSTVSVEEIYFGLTWKPKPRIQIILEQILEKRFHILPVTKEISRCAGMLRGELQLKGITRTQADMLIAATTQIHRLTLVTRNIGDFENCRIPLLNPFS